MVAEARKVIEGQDTKWFNTRPPKRRYLATEKDKLVSLRCIRSRSHGAQIMDLQTGESCEVKTNYVFQSTQFIVGGKHTTKTKQLYLLSNSSLDFTKFHAYFRLCLRLWRRIQ